MERVPTLPGSPPTELLPETSREHSRRVRTRLMEAGLHDGATWRISPTPFLLPPPTLPPIRSRGRTFLGLRPLLNRLTNNTAAARSPTGWPDNPNKANRPA